eukprot:CAMPEP_0114351414 /NCGR_PEP_ID=MMETSP0101-20121206/17169_1 /TAXON_ID=38822 ORGANISM="Pteridomonas danica, Strain PT" /NCGR_SAMPLE_ID=MMETSP0101 /ASSEMBLY_ACC=CAM_ASM_000211 /LENGTH=104 /DNA_ID=CAMNT_0001491285 /DNA_START=1221 /DNA_END=1535 /DNA_ORIENTATION=+
MTRKSSSSFNIFNSSLSTIHKNSFQNNNNNDQDVTEDHSDNLKIDLMTSDSLENYFNYEEEVIEDHDVVVSDSEDIDINEVLKKDSNGDDDDDGNNNGVALSPL